MNNKGIAGLWIWVLVSVFLCGTVYLAMNHPMMTIENKFSGNLTGDYAVTAARVEKAWNAWPMLFILLAALVMIVGSLRGDRPDQGYA